MFVDRDTAAVVEARDRVVLVNPDLDAIAIACQRLVDGVVDDLVDQVVQTARAGGTDIHARTLADGLKSLENLNVRTVVVLGFVLSHVLLLFVC